MLLIPSAPPPPGEVLLSNAAKEAMFAQFVEQRAGRQRILHENFMSDFFLCEGLPRGVSPLPGTPIIALRGDRDPFVDQQTVTLWQSLTQGHFSVSVIPGGHFFLHSEKARSILLPLLSRVLRDTL